MYMKQKNPRSIFLSFFDDFRYAGATIVALCSQGLSKIFKVKFKLNTIFKIRIALKKIQGCNRNHLSQ